MRYLIRIAAVIMFLGFLAPIAAKINTTTCAEPSLFTIGEFISVTLVILILLAFAFMAGTEHEFHDNLEE